MAFTTEERYRAYADWPADYIDKITQNTKHSPWRTNFHIETPHGLLNDPNGFSYFNGKWTLFYQYFPFGAAHGLKSWVHTESTDLVHFEPTGTMVYPDTPLDSHGAYSGSAMQFGDKLFLFYTGNVRDENWIRHPYQIGALMDTKGEIQKIDHILIDQPDDTTDHFRDPQIFNFKGDYYAIVGGQNLDKKGIIKLYKAVDNDYLNWEYVADLDFANNLTAYMMECPNLVFIDEKPILLYCPQGLDKSVLDYDNIYPNLYKIAQSFDPETAIMVDPSPLQQLDYGFECYATQAFNAPDGRALSVSWLALPDVEYPTDRYDYQGCLSLVKELTLQDGKLYQYPVEAITSLRTDSQIFAPKVATNNCYELELTVEADSKIDLVLFADANKKGLKLSIDPANGQVTLDRKDCGEAFALDFGTERHCQIANQVTIANIFIDKSVFEIFINKGEKVFSGRVFPHQDQTGIAVLAGQVTGNYYSLDYGRKTH
ncbi:sucrose-6-phosphate hydrolase [Streptococcus sp. zg-86]|uniref:Sucrose-6-phosphate hydrolase n=1 Tax=Streptococcus zhangguiae TaxID=2664091 RepID=A0A6I4R800_9STRE|nr:MULTISPECIES: sucrose-6-phosphate hydrolase [unclassified Streptococcus]MTB63688.1 sucrose-6-phosphate hydrolase [Streptococcus sp. zg-86]MTB89998.1 sucrose-6-phosphate hydrolase [Streptococcus sp. zg-36]MWV55669.1 sucrose-6-phosphate hydrolase [Streptococcus sp. zg-70]QTH48038.1 sucrose-6-phosphate hydrolase [Streptococcus sp. zg-86]